ncbi:MAG TPA: cytochrome c [Gemmatimonadales bacterium]
MLKLVAVAASLTLVAARAPAQGVPFRPDSLSPFATAKAETLLRDRLPCLGCHRLNGEGGAIGPDLTGVAARRPPSFIYGMITNPVATWPGTGMPKTPMPAAWARLVASYLAEGAGRAAVAEGAETLSGAVNAPPPRGIADPAALYVRVCSACHGERGGGDGFNAPNLPVKPTAHADSGYMSTRPDDTLFDGIYGGGYILNRSHRMPAFGLTLTREQVRGLVGYLRTLCRCEGPVWARR